MKIKALLLFILIILLASLWRLTNLPLIEFKGDEGLNLFLATRYLFGHPIPPASLASSVGILNFPLGFYFLLRKKDTFFLIPLFWLVCGPLAASITTEDVPNIQRAIFMLPAFQILEAYGLYYVYEMLVRRKKMLFVVCVSLAIIVNIAYFFHQYVVHSPSYAAYRRDDGTEALFKNLKEKEKIYNVFYLPSSQDLPLYYFYENPTIALPTYTQKTIDKGLRVGKYVFVSDECPERIVPLSMLQSQKSIIVISNGCFHEDKNLHVVDTIYRQDGTIAYILKALN